MFLMKWRKPAELETVQAEMEEYVKPSMNLADIESMLYEVKKRTNYTNYIAVECPHCNETVFFDEDIL